MLISEILIIRDNNLIDWHSTLTKSPSEQTLTTNHVHFLAFDYDDMQSLKRQVSFYHYFLL